MAWNFLAKTGPPGSQGKVGLTPSLQGVVPKERRGGEAVSLFILQSCLHQAWFRVDHCQSQKLLWGI